MTITNKLVGPQQMAYPLKGHLTPPPLNRGGVTAAWLSINLANIVELIQTVGIQILSA